MVSVELFSKTEVPRRYHVHHELRVVLATAPNAVAVNAEPARVIYITEGFLDRNEGRAGHMSEPKLFPTLEAAQKAEIPPDYVTAYIASSQGDFAWEPRFRKWLRAA